MKDWTRRGHALAALATLGVAGALLWYLAEGGATDTTTGDGFATTPEAEPWPTEDATYVGSAACEGCHEDAFRAYRGSDHDRATVAPTAETILAPFDGRAFERDGLVTTFSRNGERYVVRAEGAGGALHDYEVRYALGSSSIQRYVLDVGGGRLQALNVAWDVEGERFYDLDPERISPDDRRHWTRREQSWNAECAECHSTAVDRGWDPETQRLDTTFAERDVGCEACHGPGSVHVAWANEGAPGRPEGLVVRLRRAPPWTEGAEPREDAGGTLELETCAPCHSRREALTEGHRPGAPFLDSFRPELVSRRLYHHDGQLDAEAYEYGSFLQSPKSASVRCSHCHDPHSLSLRREGNALCADCHSAQDYDDVAHHHHADEGSACVDCHMMEKTYFEVDGRRDHAFRVPRPDLAAALGVPDACTGCHEDEGSAWAADRVAEWFGADRPAHWGEALHAARRREPGAAEGLAALAADEDAPPIARGTALALLDDFPGRAAEEALAAGVRSPIPLVRLGAAYGARELEAEARWRLISPLSTDELRAIRVEAARTLAVVPTDGIDPREAEALDGAIDELIEVERRFAHRPDAWLRIGRIERDRARDEAADRAFREALVVEPRFTPAMVELADLRRSAGDEVEAEALLRRAVETDETDADAHHALGLLLVRTGRAAAATPLFARAVELRADDPRFHLVLGVALHDEGDVAGAIEALERGVDAHQNDADLLRTLAAYAEESGDHARAREVRAMLARVAP